jgi:hypothetical protein
LSSDKEGNVILSMIVPVDTDLIQWVLGWSDKARVLKPMPFGNSLLPVIPAEAGIQVSVGGETWTRTGPRPAPE